MVYRVEKSIWEGCPYPDDYRQHVGRSMDGHFQHETPRGAMRLTLPFKYLPRPNISRGRRMSGRKRGHDHGTPKIICYDLKI
jgi:hypothetical protein